MPRPKLNIPLTATDKIVEALGWAVVIALWALATYSLARLPNTIPTHFSASGTPDGYGDKYTLLTLPLIATVLFSAITVLGRFPHVFNYPTQITAENALRQYTAATRLLRYLKLIVAVIFFAIAQQTIATATGGSSGLGAWFLPITLAGILGIVATGVVKMMRAK